MFFANWFREDRVFSVGDSIKFAAQIPDDSVGCSGSRCTNCMAPVAYCNQVCRTCGYRLIGPFGFPQFSEWEKLSLQEKRACIDRVFAAENHGRSGYSGVPEVPLSREEAEQFVNAHHRLFGLHGITVEKALSPWKGSAVVQSFLRLKAG